MSGNSSFDEALALHQGGRITEAEAIYRRVLQQQPRHPGALHLLGVIRQQQGDHEAALELIGQAISINPRKAVYRNNYGAALQSLGRQEEAAESFQRALAISPNYADALANVGKAQESLGRVEPALLSYRKALQIEPFHEDAIKRLAALLQELGRETEAIPACENAVARRPSAALYVALGNALAAAGRTELAAQQYRKAIELAPGSGAGHACLGSALLELGDLDGAERSFRAALRGPEEIGTGKSLPLDSQSDSWRGPQPVRISSWHAQALAQLATMLGDKLPDEDCEALRRMVEEGSQMPSPPAPLLKGVGRNADRATLCFGLAHALDARGAYDQAAKHLLEANDVALADARQNGHAYDANEHARLVDGFLAVCTPEFFRRVQESGLRSERPVFVFGLPRSGTTLIEQILASHSQVFGAGELRLAAEDYEELAGFQKQAVGWDQRACERRPTMIDSKLKRNESGNKFPHSKLPRSEGTNSTTTYHTVCLPREELSPIQNATALEALRRLDHAAICRVGQRHLARLLELSPTAARVVDKMPDNYLYLGLLAALFPRATFIHCRRDLRDVAVSCWMTNFSKIRWANDLEHIAGRYEQYGRLMAHWRHVLPVSLHEVDYEETVADLEGVARRLVAWCSLEWEPGCLAFHESKRPVRTASAAQVRRPIYNRSVGRWKHYEKALGPLFDRLRGNTEDI